MIRNYIKIAWRNLWKDRTFTALNIIGLTTSFGVAFLLCTYALYEFSYNQFHDNVESIYQVYTNEETPKGVLSSESNPIPFAQALQQEVPGIKRITRYTGGGPLITYKDKTLRLGAVWVDPDFFNIFTFPVIKGDKTNPIKSKSSMAITQEAALKLFGQETAINKTVTIQRNGEEMPITINAILEDIPSNSSIGFEVALNFKNLPDRVYADNLNNWDKHNHEVYLELDNTVSAKQFEKSTEAFSALHYAEDIKSAKRDGIQPNADGFFRQIHLFSFKDISFSSVQNGVLQVRKTLEYIILFVALLILFIACVNFINMSIARGSQRLREIGMRKTLGANKRQLFFQFWGESILVFVISTGLGGFLAFSLLKPFQDLFRTDASFKLIADPFIIVSFLISLLIITLIAGGYPALLMSKLGTIQALKGKIEVTGRNRVRNILMVVQFSIAILLISGTLVLSNQLDYLRTKDLGFNKEQVISFPLNTKKNKEQILQLLRNELENKPEILSITASNNILGLGKDMSSSTSVLGFDYKGRGLSTNMLMVDYDYLKTLDIELLKGRAFDKNRASDSLSVIINESMVKEFNEKDPLNAHFILSDSLKFSVIGVVKDYHFQGLEKEIEPITLFMNRNNRIRYGYVKVASGDISQSYDLVKSAWNKIEPDTEFMGSFLDENIDRTLSKERKMTTMISSGSLLAIILSCIGLFAISLLVVAQRRKEIGIRKIVGASISKITIMLSIDFLKLVLIAFVIATPIAWYLSSQWLQNYTYRINLSLWVFLTAGSITVLIALATISIKTIKAALQNPVKSLKTE